MGILIELEEQDYKYCLDYASGKTNTMALNNINRIIKAIADGKQCENRLKADTEAILTELQLEIEEKEQYYQDKFLESKNAVHDAAMGGRMFGCGECKEAIQQKINALKESKLDESKLDES